MIKNRERTYINVVKGIAIVFMIWGHCIQYCAKGGLDSFGNPVYQFIYSFHMPLFMMISGYLFYFSFQKRDLRTLLVHRTQGMLQPIVFGSILNIFLIELPTFLLHGTIDLFNGALLGGLYSLWFLWCVLSSGTAVAIAGKAGKSFFTQLLYLVLGFFFVALFPENEYHMYMYPYFTAGFLYGKYRSRIPAWITKLAYLSVLVFPRMLPDYHREHLIYSSPVYIPEATLAEMAVLNGFRWGIGFAGSLLVLSVAEVLFKLTVDRNRKPKIFDMLAKLGENSLAIYCISVSLLSYYLPKVYDRFLLIAGRNIFAENVQIYNYVFTPILTVLYCFGLYYVVQLMKKAKIHRLIFGR